MSAGELARAHALAQAGRPAEGLEIARLVLQADPEDAEALTVVSGCLTGLGRHDEALTAAREAVGLDSENERSWRQLAHVASTGGLHLEAYNAARVARRLAPETLGVHLCVIWTDLAADLVTDETRTTVVHAMTNFPDAGAVYVAAGHVALRDERYRSASSSFRAALHLDPGDEAARQGLARVKLDLGKAPAAFGLYLDVLQDDPSSRPALLDVRRALHGVLRRVNRLWGAMTAVSMTLALAAAVVDPDFDGPVVVGLLAVQTPLFAAWTLWYARRTARTFEGRGRDLVRLAPSISLPHTLYAGVAAAGCVATILFGGVAAVMAPGDALSVVMVCVWGLPVVAVFVTFPLLNLHLHDSPRRAARG